MTDVKSDLSVYIDKLLSENFTQIATIKENDNSKIYLYSHNKTKKKLIKRISAHRNDEVFRKVRNLECKSLSQIYEVCSDEDCVTVLEEYIDGISLLELIEKKQTLPKKQAYKITIDICDALNELHSRGIVHRDIKPSNVMVRENGEAVLIDLSIARMISSNSESDTQNLGSIGYASPEQFGLSQTGKTTDIYSLGVLLNIMLTGVHPAINQAGGFVGNMIKKMTAIEIKSRYQDVSQIKKRIKILKVFSK